MLLLVGSVSALICILLMELDLKFGKAWMGSCVGFFASSSLISMLIFFVTL